MGIVIKKKKSKKEHSTEIKSEESYKTITYKTIKDHFANCNDVSIDQKTFCQKEKKIVMYLIACEANFDSDKLNKLVLPVLSQLMEIHPLNKENIQDRLTNSSLPTVKKVNDLDEVTKYVFNGKLIIYFETFNETFSIDIAKHPQRNPEEPNTEISVKGPRDGFIEEIPTNIALIRKRLKTNTLKVEKFCIGTRTQTDIALLYVKDIINEDTLKAIKDRLDSIPKIDALFSLYHLQDLLTEAQFKLVPIFNYTGRPDFAVQSLLQGRFTILMDGVPTAILAPVTLSYLTKSPEDDEYITLYVGFTRALRLIGLLLATFLPGFWVALVTFHQDQIPFVMLGTLAETRRGVPFPSPIEAFLMLGLFELFREAGMRLPSAIGQTLTVVGGLIIGQAAIQAGLTNPAMVVVMAIALVANFTLIDQSLIGTITVIRLLILVAASILGLFGEICFSFIVLIYLSNVTSFNIPYLAPISPLSFVDLFSAYLRLPWSERKKRAKILETKDTSRQE